MPTGKTHFKGQYYTLQNPEKLLSALKNFKIDGTVHFGENGLINIDGSFCYEGNCSEDLSAIRFGVIRGHACFSKIPINKLAKRPKIEYANLLTFQYNDFPNGPTHLLSLLRFPPFHGILRLVDQSKTGSHIVEKEAIKIINKHQESYRSANGRREESKEAIFAAQQELIVNGYGQYAAW